MDARSDERTGVIRGRTDRGNAGGIMPSDGSGQFVDARPDIVDGGAGVMPMNGPGQFVDERTEATPAGSWTARADRPAGGVMKIFRTARGALPEGARHDR